MGKRARRKRAEEKRLARWFGIREDELGRLRKTMTKAEARRKLIRERLWFRQIEYDLVERATRQAVEDICAEEDARVLAELDAAVNRWASDTLSRGFVEGSYDG